MRIFLLDIKAWEIDKLISILHLKISTIINLGCTANENLTCCFCRNQNQKMVKIVKSCHRFFYINGIVIDIIPTPSQLLQEKMVTIQDKKKSILSTLFNMK